MKTAAAAADPAIIKISLTIELCRLGEDAFAVMLFRLGAPGIRVVSLNIFVDSAKIISMINRNSIIENEVDSLKYKQHCPPLKSVKKVRYW